MILYINGDSHSYGHDAGGPSHSYGQHIANELGAEFICHAEPASSNDRIIRTTREYLLENRPDLLIIGWSTWEREEWFDQDQWWQITPGGQRDNWPQSVVERYKHWVIDIADRWLEKEQQSHELIWQFHQELEQQNIPHLFFNCYSWFFYTTKHNLTRHSWGPSYIDPYSQDTSYYFWLENQGFTPANPKFYHYGAEAHKDCAQYLLTYIKKESIITT